MAYTIRISEEQRVALLGILESAGAGRREGLSGMESIDPLAYWQDMLTDLPKVESEVPGALHGFCL